MTTTPTYTLTKLAADGSDLPADATGHKTEYLMVDPAYFPDCDGEWIWTATEDLAPPAGYAWAVYLSDGTSLNNHQGGHYQVRAVRA